MPAIITDGDFTVAVAQGAARFSQPFEGDSGAYLLEQDFMMALASWAELALDTAHATYTDYYLVGESTLQDKGAGIVQWTRTYAAIPAARSDYESFSATFPEFLPAEFRIVIALVAAGAESLEETTLTANAAHGLAVGDEVVISYVITLTDPSLTGQGIQLGRQIARTVLGTSGLDFTVEKITDAGAPAFLYASKGKIGRKAFTKVVSSRIDFEYFLPGVSGGITTPDDIPILEPQEILNTMGERIEAYSDLSTPDRTAYEATLDEWVVAEASVMRRWRGNIIEAATRYVRAE